MIKQSAKLGRNQLLFRAMVLVACGASGLGCAYEGGQPEEVDQVEQEVINGSTDFSYYYHYKWATVGVRAANGGNCSGTLLRNNVVLTARHCVTSDGLMGGPVGNVAFMRARVQGYAPQLCPNYAAGTCSTVATIVAAPYNPAVTTNSDAALLVLSTPLNVNGDSENFFTPLDPWAASKHVSKWPIFVGYGYDGSHANGDVERMGQNGITATNSTYGTLTDPAKLRGMHGTDNYVGSASNSGDSGGGLWLREGGQPTLIGVTSAGQGTAFGSSTFAQVADVRYQFNKYISDNLTPIVDYGSFGAASFAKFQQISGAPNSNPNWQLSGTAIIQKNNTDRSLLVLTGKIYENVSVGTEVSSVDDDGLGLIVRYEDPDNYLYCEANNQSNYLRIVKRQWGSDSVIASVTWTGNFSTAKSLVFQAHEKSVFCNLDGLNVSGTQSGLVAGRVGMLNIFNDEGKFHSFAVGPESVPNSSW